ncbi:uncharacterized protein At4g15970-like [Vitis riparia]|uniref:uncharacterized protein At4g15970-like n=1 Tax=Vitis riparia TaxID=96939 RepID=UPI00155A8687|nr:uncharacterized protein At4g15970-like [Vitis riparia]
MPDRTVILTILDQAWARPGSVLELFLESFKVGVGTKKLLNHLVIVTTDDQAFQYCKAMHPHCFPLPTPEDFVARKPLMHPDRSKFGRRTIRLLGEVDELGYNFVFTDADVMWLKNPFLYVDPIQDLTIACEVYTGDPKSTSNKADRGFFFVKSTDISVEFLKYWEVAMVLHPDHDAQSVLEMIKEDEVVQFRLRVRIKYLDTVQFSGFCQPNKDMRQVHTMHANCCEDLESKVHDLRLVLDDWRNSMTSLSTPGSSWRVPSKCKEK